MCHFSDWSSGDVKYVVEHWARRDAHRYANGGDGDEYTSGTCPINWDAPSREHLCPGCAVSRGLDYDAYYVQNKNAPPMPAVGAKKRKIKHNTEQVSWQAQQYLGSGGAGRGGGVARLMEFVEVLAQERDGGSSNNNSNQRSNDSNSLKSNETSSDNGDKLRLDYIAEILSKSSSTINTCHIRPHPECPLFVAWNGVIVLVYAGFPPSLITTKEQLSSVGGNGLPKLKQENFGSKWPKTTMAAVFDNAPDMTIEELTRLKQMCQDYGKKIADSISNAIRINQLSLVQYECRSLEKLYHRVDISLDNDTGFAYATHLQPSVKEREVVNSVVGEWSRSPLEEYLPKVNQPGSRMSSYRQSLSSSSTKGSESANTNAAATAIPANSGGGIGGATCVAFLDDPSPSFCRLRQVLVEFRIAVDLEFPGRYAWFAESSLHCTLRALDTV